MRLKKEFAYRQRSFHPNLQVGLNGRVFAHTKPYHVYRNEHHKEQGGLPWFGNENHHGSFPWLYEGQEHQTKNDWLLKQKFGRADPYLNWQDFPHVGKLPKYAPHTPGGLFYHEKE